MTRDIEIMSDELLTFDLQDHTFGKYDKQLLQIVVPFIFFV